MTWIQQLIIEGQIWDERVTKYMRNTWRADREKRIDTEVFNIFQKSFPQYFLVAGLHISLSDILDKLIGLNEQFLYQIFTQQIIGV